MWRYLRLSSDYPICITVMVEVLQSILLVTEGARVLKDVRPHQGFDFVHPYITSSDHQAPSGVP